MAIATPEDVAQVLRRALTEAEEAEALDLIADYQAELEALLGRAIESRATTETVTAREGRAYVSQGPISSVSALAIDGVPQAGPWTAWRDYVEVSAYDGARITLTYVGGWEPPRNRPAKRAVIMRVVRTLNREEDRAVGTEQTSVEGETVKWSPDAFSEAELEGCSNLRRRDV